MFKHYFIIVIFCVFALLCGNRAFSQAFTIRHLGVENGLSNNYIVDIAQDAKGCIWIATESGLNRFDGQRFSVYQTNNSYLLSNELNTLLYDKVENKLWIGTQRNGINIFDIPSETFGKITIENGLSTNDVTHLSLAADGGIWITHYHVGIEYYNRTTKETTLYSNVSVENLKSQNWCSADDGAGNLYVGHAQDGFSIIDLKRKTAENFCHEPKDFKSLPGNTVRSILIDSQKNVWIGTNKGLALFNPQTKKIITFSHNPQNPHSIISDNIYEIREMNNGELWIATDMGGISILNLRSITLVNPEKVVFRNIAASTDNSGLSSGNIHSIFQDSFGNIWIGNNGSGIDFIGKIQPIFQTLPNKIQKTEEDKSKPVCGIATDKEGQVWIGNENDITVFYNAKLIQKINISKYITNPASRICATHLDSRGLLWIGLLNDCILRYNPQTKQTEKIKLETNNLAFISFFEDADGKMWIGSESGIYSFQQGNIQKEDSINNQLKDIVIRSIVRDKQGKLWIGTFGKGISIFDQNNHLLSNLETDSGFISNAINHLLLDSKGGMWAATRNGLAYFADSDKPEQYKIYNEQQGLADTYIRAIAEDNNANIWISSNRSIAMWNKQKQFFDNYDHRDGISMGNFIEGLACTTSDGIIYFGSTNGICCFNPATIAAEQQVASIQIMECKVFNRQIESREEGYLVIAENGRIELPYNQNSFRISFSSPNYAQSGQVEYAYMIEGLDNKWYNTQGENQVTFRNLANGQYVFSVKSRLRNGEWDEVNIASLTIIINPPFWMAWYAKLLYSILLIVGIVYIIRFYLRRMNLETSLEIERKESQNRQELNDERLRFYTNITHELRTPLTLILGPLEDLLNDKNLSDYYNKKIEIIHSSATRLLNLINQILEFRKTETQNRRLTVSKGNLANLVTEIGLRYKEINRNDKVKYNINIEAQNAELYFDSDMITTILSNLLSNAVKYTTQGEIRITLRELGKENNRYMEIEVSDSGYGIEKEALPYIFDRYYQAKGKHQASGTGIGLALVKSLTDLHEGIINVTSEVGRGTTFSLQILKYNSYPNALHKEGQDKAASTTTTTGDNLNAEDENDNRPMLLVVEDNTDIREYISTSFAAEYQIISASNGKEGLELAQKHIPNIIVSDIMMPIMDGIELCKKIKEDIRTSHIPIILLTAKDTIQDKETGYISGADSYLTKPFSAKLLQSRIGNLLESRQKLAQQITANIHELTPEDKDKPLKISALDQKFLAQITEIIEANLDSDQLDISFILKKIRMSHSTFYRKIKGLTSISANEFIRKIRLKNSVLLLMSGEYNVSEIAYMCGFNDVDYFRECFKKEYGMSPKEYLKQNS
ncbi:MAG: response regulator [Paludibacter sp.]|jgi:signal transduction histidine kinase/ligand-binding sensor domain-containing protein/DNA-binding response OmpR family regulator|nr:response regulator [Paludibacter sp.]